MTIQTIPRRLPEVGRLRLGERQPTRNGQTRPAALAAWRLTSKSRFRLEAAAKLYGGQVREWKDAPPEQGEQFELYTEAKALKVAVVAFYDNQGQAMVPYSQFYELWAAGGCRRRCNGKIETISGEPCLCRMESDIPAEYGCDPITRFSVLLPDVPGLGSWRCETHGYYAAMEIPGSIDLLLSLGRTVPVALVIDQRSEKRPGQPRRDYVVPMLDSRQSFMDLQMLAAADPATGELEMDEGRAITPPDGLSPSPTSEARGEAGDHSAASRRSLASDLPPGEGQRVHSTPTEVSSDQSVAVKPSPGPTPGGVGTSATSPGALQGPLPDGGWCPPETQSRTPHDHLQCIYWWSRETSPPSGHPGKVVDGGDPTSGPEGTGLEPSAAPAGGGTAAGPDTNRVGSGAIGGTAVPDPTPESLTLAWCGERGVNPRHARLHLAKAHKDEFGDLRDWKDMAELEGERATKAILYLDVWWNEQQER